MKNRAFTLIELLVVVLIMGILVAIALPQYQKAVEKTRAAEAMTVLKTIAGAEEVYYLTNGSYTLAAEELDVEIPQSKYFDYSLSVMGVTGTRKDGSYLLAFRYQFQPNPTKKRYRIICGVAEAQLEEKAKDICKRLGADISKSDSKDGRWAIVE